MSSLFIQTLSFVHLFLHSEDLYSAPSTDYYSFILKIYIALHSTPSVDYYSFSHSGDLKYYIAPLITQKLLSWNDSSSGGTEDTNSLYRASLALCWLSALHIDLCWVPALYYSPSLAPNNSILHYKATNMLTRSKVELQPLNWLPVLHIELAPYTGPHNSGLHLKNYRLEVDLQPQTSYSPTHLKDSKLEVELQPLHWLPILHTDSLHPVLPQGFP